MSHSSLNELIDVLRVKSELISQKSNDREDLSKIFSKALRKTVIEIQRGANLDDFTDLAVINLIIMADSDGYSPREINDFVQKLKPYDV